MRIGIGLMALVAGAGMAVAEPRITERTKTYSINATTFAGLRNEMNGKGPNGFWAYTAWDIRWTGSCRVTLKLTYTLPKHRNPSSMPDTVRKRFDGMMTALVKHEQQHGAHAKAAAREIERTKCRDGNAILEKLRATDIAFDKRTNHGIRDGATLP